MQFSHIFGVKQRPFCILLHSLHEQIRNPQSIKHISRPLFFFTVILLQLQETFNLIMPWFNIGSTSTLPLSCIRYVSHYVIQNFHQWNYPVTHVTNVNTNTPCLLKNCWHLRYAFILLFNVATIFFLLTHRHQETRTHLLLLGSTIEECWSCVYVEPSC